MGTLVSIRRVVKTGIVNMFRNGLVSIATILVMSLSMLMLASVLVGNLFLGEFISGLEQKVDVSVYFKRDAPERDIFDLKTSLTNLLDVKEVRYVSRDEALKRFLDRHKNDEIIARSVEVVGENPFSASLEIRATDPSKYESIAKFIEQNKYRNVIDINFEGKQKITYRQNQETIDKLSALLRMARTAGIIAGAVLAAIALIVAYNTVRLAIFNSRDEIAVMQVVGASRGFIRGPFLVEGVLHGIVATLVSIGIFYPSLWWLGSKTENAFGGLNVFDALHDNIYLVIISLLIAGILLGAFSSRIAIRRYLKV